MEEVKKQFIVTLSRELHQDEHIGPFPNEQEAQVFMEKAARENAAAFKDSKLFIKRTFALVDGPQYQSIWYVEPLNSPRES